MKFMQDLKAFRLDPLKFFSSKATASEKPLVKLSMGMPRPVYLVTDAALIKPVMHASEEDIDKGWLIRKLRRVVGRSSITLNGEEHKQRRAIIHKHLMRGMMDNYVPEISAQIRHHTVFLLREGFFDAHEVTAPLALRIITSILFGRNALSNGDQNALIDAVNVAEHDLADSFFRLLPDWPWVHYRKRKELEDARALMAHIVDRVRARATSNSLITSLEQLDLSLPDLRDEILLLLLAGHHTSGTAAAWLLYHMAVEPGLADRLAEEALSVIDPTSGEVDPRKLPRASMSQHLAKEVLRLYPSFPWYSREVKRPLELAGTRLKKGTTLLISSWQMHRDPRYWDDPNKFNLERNYTSPSYIPFGTGPRACVGMGLGILELQLLALEIASACTVQIASEVPAPLPKAEITLIPPKIILRLHPRKVLAPHLYKAASA